MTRVFISHSNKDVEFICNRLRPLFDEYGVIAWCSATDIRMAADWQRQIRAALTQADWFIVVLSPDAQESEWVQAETHWALEHMRGRVIPLMARTCKPADVHLRLETVQYIDFRSSPDVAGKQLVALILGTSPDGESQAPAPHEKAKPINATTTISDRRQAAVLFFVQPPVGSGYERQLEIRHWAVIGRANDADMQILQDCISRRHAKISVCRSSGETALIVTDLDSTNGTFVNRQPVLSGQALAVGDVVEIGDVQLHVRAIDWS